MRGIIILLSVFTLLSCGTKYNYIDTGTSIGYFDGSLYDYLKQDRGHWDSIAKVIDKCSPEVIDILKNENITFFGPKNIAFEKFFFWGDPEHSSADVVNYNTEGYNCIDNLPQEWCDSIVKSHIVMGRVMRDDVPRAEEDDKKNIISGGKVMTTLKGNKLWVWTIRNAFAGVPETADVEMRMAAVKADGHTIINNLGTVATTNLDTKTGVVHALADNYFLGQFFEIQ